MTKQGEKIMAKLIIDTKKEGEPLGDLFGIFFEDLNHAADGGLYGEMVQNRAFEFDSIDNPSYHHLTAWEKIEEDGAAELVVETGNPVNEKNPHYLGLDIMHPGSDVGVWNQGFNSGFAFRENESYYFSCYVKREQDLEAPLAVSFRSSGGEVYAQKCFQAEEEWKKVELEITSPVTDYCGRLAITAGGRGKIYLDYVSLFPKNTYRGRKNGMRCDIAQALEDLHPRFMRFPGGCLVHCGSLDERARDAQYRWKNTIGPLEGRPARRSNWDYNQTLGLGYYEYFQFCEDIGAKPLPVLPAGYNPHEHRAAPIKRLQPWIDDALDLIEFANGNTDTYWGFVRKQMGHPEPFGLEYIAIGNEEVGEEFFERYAVIAEEVREKYPQMKIIGTSGPFASGSEFERGWESARQTGTDLVDEHYYQSPEWLLAHHHRYDNYDRKGPKAFLGEYASWGDTWYHALAESSYMLGLERNAGAVGLACYAPLLCNADYVNWKPDLIWFNNHEVYATASYYVQKLFMHHQGEFLVPIRAEELPAKEIWTAEPDRLPGRVLLENDGGKTVYSDVVIRNEDTGEEIRPGSFMVEEGCREELCEITGVNYTVSMKAKKMDRSSGFRIAFAWKDEDNHHWWALGGHSGEDTYIGEQNNGKGANLSHAMFSVEEKKEYSLKLCICRRKIEAWVDGKCILNTVSKPIEVEPLYYSASRDANGDLIVKVTNMRKAAQEVELCLEGGDNMADGTVYQMAGWKLNARNDFEHPNLVSPCEKAVKAEGKRLEFVFPGESFTVLRLKTEKGREVPERKGHK